MADEIDRATENEGVILNALIKGQSKVPPQFINYEQKCINCGEPVETTAYKFCCIECEMDYRARQEAERRKYG